MKALLLTGAPGCGKTTIVKKVADTVSGRRIRGFLTGEIRRDGRPVGFELPDQIVRWVDRALRKEEEKR